MAAEAPITAKKGEYSGLSSEDILALVSGGGDDQRRLETLFDLGRKNYVSIVRSRAPKPTSFSGTSWRKAQEAEWGSLSQARRTGVAEENGETEKVT